MLILSWAWLLSVACNNLLCNMPLIVHEKSRLLLPVLEPSVEVGPAKLLLLVKFFDLFRLYTRLFKCAALKVILVNDIDRLLLARYLKVNGLLVRIFINTVLIKLKFKLFGVGLNLSRLR